MQKHILVVDDEAVIRDLLDMFLSRSGYRVTAVSSAPEAEEVAGRDRPDLVITDLQLEDSDGLEMIERLKALLPETPMMLLTGVMFDPKVDPRDPQEEGLLLRGEDGAPDPDPRRGAGSCRQVRAHPPSRA
jgi:CheY-like chemotaxis protein